MPVVNSGAAGIDVTGKSGRAITDAIIAGGRNTLLALMSEVGFDLSEFATAKNFTTWLSLSPNNKISGGKMLSSHTFKGKNRLSEALQRAANVIGNMKDNPLSDFFHRIAYKKGRMHGITATGSDNLEHAYKETTIFVYFDR